MIMKRSIFTFFFLITIFGLNAQDGVLDASFGTGGKVIINIDNSDNVSKAIAVQPDGKIILAGYGTTSINFFSIARLNTNGTPDISFGVNGFASTILPSSGIASSVVLQGDGKIIAGGHSWGGSYNEFTLTRYNTNGTPDATFGSSGIVTTSFLTQSGIGKSLAIQPDGKIILAGFAYNDFNDDNDFALVRYNTNGSLDSTFGVDGMVFTSFGLTQDWINTIELQADGKIIAGGFAGGQMAMARYLVDGNLDPTFATGGKFTSNISTVSQAGINGMILDISGI